MDLKGRNTQERAMPRLSSSFQWPVWAVVGWRLVSRRKPSLCDLQQWGTGPAGAVLHQGAGGLGSELMAPQWAASWGSRCSDLLMDAVQALTWGRLFCPKHGWSSVLMLTVAVSHTPGGLGTQDRHGAGREGVKAGYTSPEQGKVPHENVF